MNFCSPTPVHVAITGPDLAAHRQYATRLREFDRYIMQRMLTLDANIAGEDLGRVSRHVERAIHNLGELPPKVNVAVRGQIAPMNELFGGLVAGLGVAVLVIFLLLTAN